MSDPKHIFTSSEAVAYFKEHTGFQFHPTVPGQLLARRGIWKLFENVRPSQFDGAAWPRLWADMLALAHDRCRYNAGLARPLECAVPPLTTTAPLASSVERADRAPVGRRYIDVPIREKDEANALGARWDPDAKLWFIPDGLDRKDFRWPDKTPRATKRRRARTSKLARKMDGEAGERNDGSSTSRIDAEARRRLRHLIDKPDKDDAQD